MNMEKNNTIIENLSGLEQLRLRIKGILPESPIFKTMGIKIIKTEKGYVQLEAVPGLQHLNAMGVVQGGVTASILDAATGCAIQTFLEAGVRFATMDLNVKYIRPVKVNDCSLIAEGRTLHVSNRTGMAEGTLKDKNGRLYACASATCMIFRKNSGLEITALESTN